MSFGMVAAAVIGAGATAYAAHEQAGAAKDAAGKQRDAAMAGMDLQQQKFERMMEMLQPYTDAGKAAIGGQQNLLGLNGFQQQQDAINNLKASAQFSELEKTGQNAILQNASATGGLRGGNTQAALAQFSPQLLNQLIAQQMGGLGGLAQLGQNAAVGSMPASVNNANQQSNLLQQAGAAEAGGAMAQGNARAAGWNSLGSLAGLFSQGFGGGGGFGGFGGGGSGGGFANWMGSGTLPGT